MRAPLSLSYASSTVVAIFGRFPIDLTSIAVSGFDLISLDEIHGGAAADSANKNLSKLKAFRVIRVLRLIKLLRLARSSRIFQDPAHGALPTPCTFPPAYC